MRAIAIPALTTLSTVAQTPTAPPTDGLVLWLRADEGIEQDGASVVRWADASGYGHDAHSEDGGRPVLMMDARNGLPAVSFDGVRAHMIVEHAPELNAEAGFSVLCVFRWTGGFRIAQKKSHNGGIAPDAWFLSPGEGLGVGGKWGGGGSFRRGRWYVQSNVFDPADATIRIFDRGSQIKVVNDVPVQAPNEDPIHLGRRLLPGGTEGHLKGELAELLIYNRALTVPERQSAEEYLSVKYDIPPYQEPTIYMTRVIPGHQTVTVEWLPPEAEAARYVFEVRLKEEPWDKARRLELPPDRRSATVDGLWNNADYHLRVTAYSEDGGPVGVSAERIVAPGPVPGVAIDYLHREDEAFARHGQYVGSPSIARLDDGRLVASHDLFGPGPQRFSRVFRSDDRGETWEWVCDVAPAFWGKLFVHLGELYLLATATEYGDLLLHRSPDGGDTWDGPSVIAPGTYHKAPVPTTEHSGKLWTCVELQTGGWPAGFQAVACSVPVDADLMDSASWTISDPLPYDPAWLPEGCEIPVERQGYLEGNAVVDPDGNLLNILRYNTTPHYRKAVVLNIADDGRSLSFNRLIDFYGGMTKFTIRRHPETGVYWSLVNRVTIPDQAGMRSVLSLVWSKDLNEWHVVRDILRDDRNFAVRYTGFQYVDWLFDGPDLMVASRTAFNGANNFHDANYLTFHRVEDFAEGGP